MVPRPPGWDLRGNYKGPGISKRPQGHSSVPLPGLTSGGQRMEGWPFHLQGRWRKGRLTGLALRGTCFLGGGGAGGQWSVKPPCSPEFHYETRPGTGWTPAGGHVAEGFAGRSRPGPWRERASALVCTGPAPLPRQPRVLQPLSGPTGSGGGPASLAPESHSRKRAPLRSQGRQ